MDDSTNNQQHVVPPDSELAADVPQTVPTAITPVSKKPRKKMLLVGLTALAVALIGGSAGAYFGYVVPNKPENLWQTALQRTADGYDTLLGMSKDIPAAEQVDGTFKLTGPVSTDGSFQVKTDGKSMIMTANAGVVASRVNAELRLIDAPSSEYPDAYLKIDGVKDLAGYLPTTYANLVKTYDGQWLSADHTFIESAVQSSTSEAAPLNQDITAEDLRQIGAAIAEVNRDFLFTTDTNKAVLGVINEVGKEKQDDRSVYHYVVGLNKENAKSYVTALAAKLEGTPAKKFTNGKSVAEAIDVDALKKSIDSYKESDTADVYVDTATKMIRTIRLTDKDKNAFELGLHMTEDNVLPFVIKTSSKDDDGVTMSFDASLTFDTTAKTSNATAKLSSTGSEQDSAFTMSAQTKPLSSMPNVDRPASTKSLDLLIGDIQKIFMGSTSTSFNQTNCSNGSTTCRLDLDSFGLQGI